jgi:hypothetical protein
LDEFEWGIVTPGHTSGIASEFLNLNLESVPAESSTFLYNVQI